MDRNGDTAEIARNGANRERKLNVILHGLFAFFVGPDKKGKKDAIVAYLPNLGSEHVYKAGTWLGETALDEHADLTLEGVDAGEKAFDPEKNFLLRDVRVCDCGCQQHSIYARLRFPLPETVHSLEPYTLLEDSLGGADRNKVLWLTEGKEGSKQMEESEGEKNGPKTKRVQSATVQVLTYSFKTPTELSLRDTWQGSDDISGHPWVPVLESSPEGDYVNLHIFSDPERSPTEDHVRHAFQACNSVFAGLDITLRRPVREVETYGMESRPPKGVHPLELEDLPRRRRRLDVLGRAIRQQRDLNSIWDEPTPFEDGDPPTCGFSAVGGKKIT